jgi:hypothetical protein
MNQLTAFERALLAEFESLAAACERSGRVSADTAARLSQASRHFSSEIATLRQRQSALERRLSVTTAALNEQTRQTSLLVEQVRRLVEARTR